MKKGILLLLLLMPYVGAWSNEVSQEEARQKAMAFVGRNKNMAKGKRLQMVSPQKVSQTLHAVGRAGTGLYAFNVGECDGFVLVSADDRTPAILGYADQGSFVPDSLPDNMRYWLQEYDRQIGMLDKVQAVESGTQRAAIEPLVASCWNQGSPYNYLCPTDSYTGLVCYTGCVATAMAQVINYHKYPSATICPIPAYTTSSRNMDIEETPVTSIDWGMMQDVYGTSCPTGARDAVATLMMLCGRTVEMDYTSSGSGAYARNIPIALRNIFGYDGGIRFLYRANYTSSEWNDIVYHEIAEQRPVIYGGQATGGGHAFVIDGYSEDELFHVNWGWGGYCDGYFLLSILNPYSSLGAGASSSKDGYSMNQNMVIGIQPLTGETVSCDALTTGYLTVDASNITTTWNRDGQGGFAPGFNYQCYNNTMSLLDFEVGIGVYDMNGTMVESHSIKTVTLDPLGTSDTTVVLNIGANLADGSYKIRGISRRIGSDTWVQNVDCGTWQIEATVENDVLTLVTPYYGLSVSGMQCLTEQPIVGSPVTMKASITNQGTYENDVLYLRVNNVVATGIYFEADHGETKDFEISYVPTTSGSNRVELLQKWGSSYHSYYTTYVTVRGQDYAELLCEIGLEGLNNKGCLGNSVANVSMKVTNNWVQKYNNSVYCALYKYDGTQGDYTLVSQKSTTVSLNSEESATVELTFEGLENNERYKIVPAYRKESSQYYDTDGEVEFTVRTIGADGEDMTAKIVNPSFELGTNGWTVSAESGGSVRTGGTASNICFEAWNNSSFDIYQTLRDMPSGVYEIQVQGFYRYLGGNNAWNAYQGGNIKVPTYVYLNNSATPFMNAFDEHVSYGSLYSGYTYVDPNYEYWYPNDMTTSSQAFSNGLYTQSAFGLLTTDGGDIRIGVKGSSNQGNDSWAIWDNFRLIYHGYAADVIEPVLTKAIADARSLLGEIMGKAAYENLSSTIENAENIVLGTDGEAMFDALNLLYDAQNEAQTSMLAFQPMTEAFNRLDWDLQTYNVAAEEVIAEVRRTYQEYMTAALAHRYEDSDVAQITQMIKGLSWQVRMPKDMDKANQRTPIECTSLLETPSFEKNGDNSILGWYSYYGACNLGNDATQRAALAIEFWQTSFSWFQDVADIPNGVYRLTASAFYRYGTTANDYTYYSNNTSHSSAYIYMEDNGSQIQTPLKALSADAQSTMVGSGTETRLSNGKLVPNDMVSSVAYFKKGLYLNECEIEVTDGKLRVGMAKPNTVASDWAIFDDFRLYYLGDGKTVRGDVNGDGVLSIADVTVLVNVMLGKASKGSYDTTMIDINDDGIISVADITALVNLLLGK